MEKRRFRDAESRNDPLRDAADMAAFFHPDCDRRLRHRTESADPRLLAKAAALAGWYAFARALTAGGEFHPALKTGAG
jgi:hypothetical protein